MIQVVYKGREIEMELHQLTHGYWKCDYTVIRHPERTETIQHGDEEFPTMGQRVRPAGSSPRNRSRQVAHESPEEVISP